MHIAMHAFGKITLFFCAGAMSHKTEISQMRGLGWRMPPRSRPSCWAECDRPLPLGGSWSKWYIALGAADAEQLIFIAVLMTSLLNA